MTLEQAIELQSLRDKTSSTVILLEEQSTAVVGLQTAMDDLRKENSSKFLFQCENLKVSERQSSSLYMDHTFFANYVTKVLCF